MSGGEFQAAHAVHYNITQGQCNNGNVSIFRDDLYSELLACRDRLLHLPPSEVCSGKGNF